MNVVIRKKQKGYRAEFVLFQVVWSYLIFFLNALHRLEEVWELTGGLQLTLPIRQFLFPCCLPLLLFSTYWELWLTSRKIQSNACFQDFHCNYNRCGLFFLSLHSGYGWHTTSAADKVYWNAIEWWTLQSTSADFSSINIEITRDTNTCQANAHLIWISLYNHV